MKTEKNNKEIQPCYECCCCIVYPPEGALQLPRWQYVFRMPTVTQSRKAWTSKSVHMRNISKSCDSSERKQISADVFQHVGIGLKQSCISRAREASHTVTLAGFFQYFLMLTAQKSGSGSGNPLRRPGFSFTADVSLHIPLNLFPYFW